jgi:dTDP-glucose pyrophosphorylase
MNKPRPWEFCLQSHESIREAIACIDRSGLISVALLVDDEARLLNTITDGDVRRGILAGLSFDDPVEALLPIKAKTPHPNALTAPVGTAISTLLGLMQYNGVRQLPLLDPEGRVVDVATLRELLPQSKPLPQAIIMAGGRGTRLLPLTESCPKPMLPVGGRPLLELTIEKLRRAGISRVSLSTNYQREKIIEHFGDGKEFGVKLSYIIEPRPLGTAGALGLIDTPQDTVLVLNGDVLTEVDYEALLDFHREQKADLTIGVRQYGLKVPYGVVDSDGPRVRSLREKPECLFFVNAGIYLLEPSVYRYVPAARWFDMTDLIQALLDAHRPVVSFPVMEYWLDIGQHADYQKAQHDAKARAHRPAIAKISADLRSHR